MSEDEDECYDKIEQIRDWIDRVEHFTTGKCQIPDSKCLEYIAKECRKMREVLDDKRDDDYPLAAWPRR